MANRDIMAIIAEVEEVREPWQRYWDQISMGFLLEEDEQHDPYSPGSPHTSSHAKRTLQRKHTVDINMDPDEQYHIVSEYNHLLDQLHQMVYDHHLGEDMHASQHSRSRALVETTTEDLKDIG